MDLIAIITFGVVLALIALIAVIAFDRIRAGWNRAAAEDTMRRRQLQDFADRAEHLLRNINEHKDAAAAKQRKITELQNEVAALQKDLDSRELPFRYTAVPTSSGDMYGPTWRFVARQPSLAEGAPAEHAAAQWDQGRPYIVGAVSQSEARSTMDRLLPRHRGFVIVAAGTIVGKAPTA